MNERQPYEQLIADKLQQLPLPDADTSWQKMKRLLDDDRPPTGGGGRNGFRPNSGWWWAGLIAVILTAGLWIFVENTKPSAKDLASAKAKNEKGNVLSPADNHSPLPKTDQNNTIGNNATHNSSSVSTTPAQDNTLTNGVKAIPANDPVVAANTPANNNKPVSTTPAKLNNDKTNNAVSVTDNNSIPVKANKNKHTPGHNSSTPANNNAVIPAVAKNKYPGNRFAPVTGTRNNNAVKDPANIVIPKNPEKNNNKLAYKNIAPNNTGSRNKTGANKINGVNNGSTSLDITVVNKAGTGLNNNKSKYPLVNNTRAGKNNSSNPVTTGDKDNNSKNTVQNTNATSVATTPVKQQERYIGLNELMLPYGYDAISTSSAAGNNIESNRNAATLLNKETKDLIAKTKKEEADKLAAKKAKKGNGLKLGDIFKPFSLKTDGEPWWAVGLSMNTSLSVGAQSRYNYNINARSGLLSDYIPSPYVQYHLNSNAYLQTELNLSAPQNTPQLLVAQSSREVVGSPQEKIQTTIYVQKLYYFNWPFSLHYSPVSNLYIAGGLQFSSLQSGIALKEERRITSPSSTGDPISSSIYKFKDDTTAARLSPNEWRWETGADYYFNRFSLGFRYNKAFKDLVNLSVSGTLPPTLNRNSSFLFFMKYNLFEGKKKESANVPRSLVRF